MRGPRKDKSSDPYFPTHPGDVFRDMTMEVFER